MIYRAINSENFWQMEMIQTAINISDKQIENLRDYIKSEKIIDYTSESNLNKKAGGIAKRMNSLDIFLIKEMASGDVVTSKFLILYSIINTEKIMYDFLNELIFSNHFKLKMYITKNEIDNFISNKILQVPEISKWTEATVKRMKSKIVEFFIQGGYLIKEKNDYTIATPNINPKVKKYILENNGNLGRILFF